jgi:hypothetical protein
MGRLTSQYLLYHRETHLVRAWPPSPALAFACLPYIRSAYDELYHRLVCPLERRWEAAIQRPLRDSEPPADDPPARNAGVGLLDIVIDFGPHEQAPVPLVAEPLVADVPVVDADVPLVADVPLDDAAADDAAADDAAVDDAEPAHPVLGRQDALAGGAHQPAPADLEPAADLEPDAARAPPRESISLNYVAGVALSALFLPTFSALAGDLLALLLPASWVTRAAPLPGRGPLALGWLARSAGGARTAPGLLQERWGRSLVGGLAFVLLRDGACLYAKWQKARSFRRKRIVDFVERRHSGERST